MERQVKFINDGIYMVSQRQSSDPLIQANENDRSLNVFQLCNGIKFQKTRRTDQIGKKALLFRCMLMHDVLCPIL